MPVTHTGLLVVGGAGQGRGSGRSLPRLHCGGGQQLVPQRRRACYYYSTSGGDHPASSTSIGAGLGWAGLGWAGLGWAGLVPRGKLGAPDGLTPARYHSWTPSQDPDLIKEVVVVCTALEDAPIVTK